jgi:hypothetical protein
VGQLVFGQGGIKEDIGFLKVGMDAMNSADIQCAIGQCPGFVEQQGIDTADLFEALALLQLNMFRGRNRLVIDGG